MRLEGVGPLLRKEVLRFWKVAFQTVAAPVLTAVLYLLIYIVAFMGIPMAGALTDGMFGDPKRLNHSLVVIGVVFGLLAMAVVLRGRNAHLAALRERGAD